MACLYYTYSAFCSLLLEHKQLSDYIDSTTCQSTTTVLLHITLFQGDMFRLFLSHLQALLKYRSNVDNIHSAFLGSQTLTIGSILGTTFQQLGSHVLIEINGTILTSYKFNVSWLGYRQTLRICSTYSYKFNVSQLGYRQTLRMGSTYSYKFNVCQATGRHSEYVVLIAFPRQQWLREPASILRYTCIASIV